jgi:hypothetical protein
MRSRPVALLPATPAIDAPVGSELNTLPPASKMLARRGWRPLRRRTSSPSCRPGSRRAGDHATRPSPCSSLVRNASVPRSVPNSAVVTATGTLTTPSRSGPSRPTEIFSTPAARFARR